MGSFKRDDRVTFRVSQSEVLTWTEHFKMHGYSSLSGFVRFAILEQIKRDTEVFEVESRQNEIELQINAINQQLEEKFNDLMRFLQSGKVNGSSTASKDEERVKSILELGKGPISWEDLVKVTGCDKETLMATLESLFQKQEVEVDRNTANWQLKRRQIE